MIAEDYVSFEVAKLLKEKGFDEPLRCWYDNFQDFHEEGVRMSNSDCLPPTIMCPTHQMAIKWLREEKRTSIIIEFDLTKRGYCPYVHQLDYDADWVVKWRVNTPMKYEEAVEAALKYALENLI